MSNKYENEKGSATAIVVVLIAVVVLGGGYYIATQSDENHTEDSMVDDEMTNETGAAGTMPEGSVVEDDDSMVGGDARVDGEMDLPLLEGDAAVETDAEMDVADDMSEIDAAGMTDTEVQGVVYENYDEAKVAEAAARGDVVLFFHASWCPTCRAADTGIQSSLDDADGLTILKTDYDTETELRQKYGVTTQHTFVQVDAEGNEIAQWTGTNTVTDIEAQVE